MKRYPALHTADGPAKPSPRTPIRRPAKVNPNGSARMKTLTPDRHVAWKGKGGAAEGKIKGC